MSGGGGSSGTYYANQDKLFGTQADIAQNMYDEYASRAPGYLDNSQTMVKEAMDGTLSTRMRNQAATDANMATTSALDAATRRLDRYGAEFNPNAVNAQERSAGLTGAMTRTAAMNTASNAAEDQKWNRNAGAFGQIAGMGTGAMQGMGSAGAGYGYMGAQLAATDRANAAGYGTAGASLASAMFKKDGGYIKAKSPELKLAGGGLATPLQDWRTRSTAGSSGPAESGSGVGQFVVGMAPTAIGYGLKEAGVGDAIKSGAKAAWDGIKSMASPQQPLGDAPMAGGIEPIPLGDAPMSSGTVDLAAANAPVDLAQATGTMTEVLPAAAEVTEAALTAEELLPLLLLKSGGLATRKDMRPGGPVTGPGTETSDSIPAMLSNKEYVLNAESTKLMGKAKLDKINNAGLAVRQGKKTPAQAKKIVKGR